MKRSDASPTPGWPVPPPGTTNTKEPGAQPARARMAARCAGSACDENHVQIAHRRAPGGSEFEAFEQAQGAGDEFRIGDPVLIDQRQPAPAKCLAALAPARADVHDFRAQAARRAQLRRASRVVEDHHIGAPGLEQLDHRRGMKGRRCLHERGRKRRARGVGVPRGSARNGCRRRSSGGSRRARWRGSARTRPCHRARRRAGTGFAARRHAKAVNQRSSTRRYQARRNSGPTARRSTPRSISRATASRSTCGWRVSQRCTGRPKPDLG